MIPFILHNELKVSHVKGSFRYDLALAQLLMLIGMFCDSLRYQ